MNNSLHEWLEQKQLPPELKAGIQAYFVSLNIRKIDITLDHWARSGDSWTMEISVWANRIIVSDAIEQEAKVWRDNCATLEGVPDKLAAKLAAYANSVDLAVLATLITRFDYTILDIDANSAIWELRFSVTMDNPASVEAL